MTCDPQSIKAIMDGLSDIAGCIAAGVAAWSVCRYIFYPVLK